MKEKRTNKPFNQSTISPYNQVMSEEKKNKDLPEEFRKYFWDCEFNELSIKKYPEFIVERVLNYGDLNSVKFLLSKIDIELIKVIISTSRNLNNKTRNFWRIMLYE